MKFYENNTKTVVFDIYGVIACAPGRYGREEEIVNKVTKRFGEEFIKDNSFTVEGYLHFIYPGVFEFIRWLVRRGVRIHFYSTGAKVRNEPLVAMVLERALSGEPNGKLGEITKGMKILSREDIYEDGLAALRSINPQLEFPLPVPSAFRDDPERFPRHQTDAERFRKRRYIDMFAAECTKRSRLVATEAIRSM